MAKPDTQAGLTPGRRGELAQLIELCREETREHFRAGAPPRDELHEAFALLLAYGCAIEKLLAQSAGGTGSLPGHISLRAYVQQLLTGDSPGSSVQRLQGYFVDAFRRFADTHLGVERALRSFTETLVDRFKPARIEARVKVGGMAKLFGGPEKACWEEYSKEYHALDAAALRKIGREANTTVVRIEIPRHEANEQWLGELQRFCEERHLKMEDV